jgi:hypothetical protein
MNEMTNEAAKVYNAAASGQDVSLQVIKDAAGLSQEELERGVRFWAETEDVRVEPESHGRRARGMASVTIGGEARHYIRFP